jgi:predicted metal-dependent TIM-barrel fold hydrolase
LKGTKLIIDSLNSFSKLDHSKVIIDHVEEHTISHVLDAGYWAGMTLYPHSKCSLNRAIDMIEIYGHERLWMNSACDWGVSDPLAVPRCMLEMKRRKHSAADIDRIVYQNPKQFLSQSPRFVE